MCHHASTFKIFWRNDFINLAFAVVEMTKKKYTEMYFHSFNSVEKRNETIMIVSNLKYAHTSSDKYQLVIQ